MLNIENKELFGEIVAKAVATAHLTCKSKETAEKWIRAIAKGAATLDGDTTFVHYQPEDKSLLFWSANSNEIYSANGICQCKAFEQNQPCYHRAMARLVRRYFERLAEPCVVKIHCDNFKGFEVTTETEVFGLAEARHLLEQKIENEICLVNAWIENLTGEVLYDHAGVLKDSAAAVEAYYYAQC